MPKLQNERHELYAKYRSLGMDPVKAAPSVGYVLYYSVLFKLETNPEILKRIDELTAERETNAPTSE